MYKRNRLEQITQYSPMFYLFYKILQILNTCIIPGLVNVKT